jgi:hypothetical protein
MAHRERLSCGRAQFQPLAPRYAKRTSKLERPANGQHVLFCEDQFAGPLPMATQLSLLADADHVIAGIADGAEEFPTAV